MLTALLALAVLLSSGRAASVHTVSNFTVQSIHDAYMLASSSDIVELPEGRYTECFKVLEGFSNPVVITFRGAGIGKTIIDCESDGHVFYMMGNEHVTLEDMTIRNASKSVCAFPSSGECGIGLTCGTGGCNVTRTRFENIITTSSNQRGSAINSKGPVFIVDSEFENNQCDDGRGAALYGIRSISIKRSTFIGNIATHQGGAVMRTGTALGEADEVEDCYFSDNKAANGGAMLFQMFGATTTTVRMSNVTFARNMAQGGAGGAVYALQLGGMTITGSTFTSSTADRGGALIANVPLTVSDTTLEDCVGTVEGGGGLYLTQSHTAVLRSVSFDTCTTAALGGGMYSESGYTVDMENVNFTDCSANLGGAWNTQGAAGNVLNRVQMSGNSASERGGGIFASSSAVTITGSAFAGCSAGEFGGGLYLDAGSVGMISQSSINDNTASGFGGGVKTNGASLTMEDITLSGNAAAIGGALHIRDGSLALTSARVMGNSAATDGGGMYLEVDTVTLLDCNFTENTATAGGGVYLKSSYGTMEEMMFSRNEAVRGGALAFKRGLHVEVEDVEFDGNTAIAGGAVSMHGEDTLVMRGCSLRANSATRGGAVHVLAAFPASSGGVLVAEENIFDANTAGTSGGAVHVEASTSALFTAYVVGGSFNANRATDGADVALTSNGPCDVELNINATATFAFGVATGDGGSLYLGEGTAVIDDAAFSDCSADGSGGAVYAGACTLMWSTSSVANNRALNGGGVALVSTAVTLQDLSVTANTASHRGGGLLLSGQTGTFTGVTVTGNSAVAGGGVFHDAVALPAGTTITGNTAGGYGPAAATPPTSLTWDRAPPGTVTTGEALASEAGGPYTANMTDLYTTVVHDPLLNPSIEVSVDAECDVDWTPPLVLWEELGVVVAPHVISLTAAAGAGALAADEACALTLQVASPALQVTSPLVVATCPAGTQSRVTLKGVVCEQCELGSYSPNSSVAVQGCIACPRGQYAPTTGLGACIDCLEGSYADDPGASRCKPCSSGEISTNGSAVCAPCSAGSYQSGQGETTCLSCPAGFYANNPGATLCLPCDAGTYVADPAAPCKPCPPMATCGSGVTQAKDGRYQLKGEGGSLYYGRCPAGYCNENNECSIPHHVGPLCGTCEEGFIMSRRRCVECSKPNGGLAFLGVFLIPFAFVSYLLAIQNVQSARIKVVTFFGQTMHLILQDNVGLPGGVTNVWAVFSLSFDWIPNACLAPVDFYGSFILGITFPFILVVMAGVLFLIELSVMKRFIQPTAWWQKMRQSPFVAEHLQLHIPMEHRYRRVIVAILLFTYTPVSNVILSVLKCRPLYEEGYNAAGDPIEPDLSTWLEADLSEQCKDSGGSFTGRYLSYRIMAILASVFYVYMMPLALLAFILFLKQKRDIRDVHTRMRYGILYNPYTTKYFWWEAYMQVRKALVVSVVVFVSDKTLKGIMLMFSLIVFMFVHSTLLPMRSKMDNRLESLCLFFLVMASLILTSSWVEEKVNSSEAALVIVVLIVFPAIVFAVVYFIEWMQVRERHKTKASEFQARKDAERAEERMASMTENEKRMSMMSVNDDDDFDALDPPGPPPDRPSTSADVELMDTKPSQKLPEPSPPPPSTASPPPPSTAPPPPSTASPPPSVNSSPPLVADV